MSRTWLKIGRTTAALTVVVLTLARPVAQAASVETLIDRDTRQSGISLSDDERQLLRRTMAVLDDRYLTTVAPDKVLDAVFASLKKQQAEPAKQPANDDGEDDPFARMDTALNAALSTLDAHTSYMTPNAFSEMRVRTRGEFGGLGLEVTMEDDLVKVVAPIDDSPAERAGIEAGDRISAVDGVSVKGMTLRDAVMRMRGRVGTPIELTVLREGAPQSLHFTVVRDVIRIRAVRYRREGNIGYIRLTSFSEKAEDGVYEALDALDHDDKPRLRGVVLDLRNNPGGLLDQAVRVADAFLNSGTIVTVKGRRSADNARYSAETGDVAQGLAMVVLINAGSASASEIVAGALQDSGRATVIGTRSFGKGSVQTIMPMGRYGALRLTTALYYTPSGRTIQARGVLPDLQVLAANDNADKSKIRREENLDHALPTPAALKAQHVSESAAPTVTGARCRKLLARSVKDGELACALALLQLGGINPLASAAAAARP